MALLILAFLGTFGLLVSAGLLIFYRDTVRERLWVITEGGQAGSKGRWRDRLRSREGAVEQIVLPFGNVLPRSAREVSILQKRLIRAGYRQESAVNMFYGAKIVVPLVLLALAIPTGAYRYSPVMVVLTALLGGFLLPDFWLGNRVLHRRDAITAGLPQALDLMVICTEAGLSIDQTLQRVARELRGAQPEIADEFGLALLEQKAGKPREDTLKDLAERTNVRTVRAFVNTLIQSDTFGTSIAKTLRIYSETLRTQRTQKIEEEAAKTTVKLVIPLVLFIFPSIFVVVLAPAMITMSEGFAKYFSTVGK